MTKMDDLIKKFISENNLMPSDVEALRNLVEDPVSLKYIDYTHVPVGPHEFLVSPEFMDSEEGLYPIFIEEFVKLNSGNYSEAVLTGGIGCFKTTMALYTTAYQLYLLSCMKNPQKTFSLTKESEIVFIFQSSKRELAKKVDFERFRNMIAGCKYFNKSFPFNPEILTELRFPHNIQVMHLPGLATSALGLNVFGGLIDELNFMAITEKSKHIHGSGTYNQAVSIYNTLARRRKSRYLKDGKVPGILCLVSSKNHPGQFTDKKVAEAQADLREKGTTDIFVYDKKIWDVKPLEFFSPKRFEVFTGNLFKPPRIIDRAAPVQEDERDLILEVPEDFRKDFEDDIFGALKDIGGVSTLSSKPFLVHTDKVSRCFGKHPSVFSRDMADLSIDEVKIIRSSIKNPGMPRWVHIDLGITWDSTGLGVGYVPGFKRIDTAHGKPELRPIIHIDGLLGITPPLNGETQLSWIRRIVYSLTATGINVKWVSMDSYQSTDMLQTLRHKGYVTGVQSIDKTMIPYQVLKAAFYNDALEIPFHEKTMSELLALEIVANKEKIDHPATNSKDLADALCGVVYGLTMRREIWAMHGIDASQQIECLHDSDLQNETIPPAAGQ